jgi:hypothetical protein
MNLVVINAFFAPKILDFLRIGTLKLGLLMLNAVFIGCLVRLVKIAFSVKGRLPFK